MYSRQTPFPYFGGKRKVAREIWKRFGIVDNYVEPFFGSGAVLLGCPYKPKAETINDIDNYVVNVWRSIQANPEATAFYADYPVSEVDLHARHYWLITEGKKIINKINVDVNFYDAKTAGWWIWGSCVWIGRGWCSGKGSWVIENGEWIKKNEANGITKQIIHLGNAGCGINRMTNIERKDFILNWLKLLSARLRDVRISSGDWHRICVPSATYKCSVAINSFTGIFLDPPYSAMRMQNLYTHDSTTVANDVKNWAIENGCNPSLRIAVAGYKGEHEFPSDWSFFSWKAQGGYGLQGDGQGRINRERECIWFSPHCLNGNVFEDILNGNI